MRASKGIHLVVPRDRIHMDTGLILRTETSVLFVIPWGRHWMDVWRYTDWYGLGAQVRNSQKHIWRWRDWIVESLNEDKGYGCGCGSRR